MSINTYTVTGRLGTAPELRFAFDGGVAIFTARMAVAYRKRNGEDWNETTTWYDLKLFGGQAEAAAEILTKGDLVIAVGRVETREYEKKDGTKGFNTEFIANEVGQAIVAPRVGDGKTRREAPKPRVLDDEPF